MLERVSNGLYDLKQRFKGVSDQWLTESEYELLTHVGIPREQIQIRNFDISHALAELTRGNRQLERLFRRSRENYIHSMHIREGTGVHKPNVLLVHGYTSSGACYYKVIRDLKSTFNVTTLDLLGVGGSGRPTYNAASTQEAVDFFVYSIQAWMMTTGFNREPFLLVAHSCGGVLATNFLLRFPETPATGLVLLSANGLEDKPL